MLIVGVTTSFRLPSGSPRAIVRGVGASHDPDTSSHDEPSPQDELTDEQRAAVLAERAEELRELMSSSESRADEFLCQLEDWIISGYSYAVRRRKAKEEYGVDEATVDRVEALIKQGWRAESMDPEWVLGHKNMQRMRYLSVFAEARENGDLKLALRTLDSMSKAMGMWTSGDVTVNVDSRGDVSSRNRERIAELLQKMRDHAMGRGQRPEAGEAPKVSPSFGLRRVLSEAPRPSQDLDDEFSARRVVKNKPRPGDEGGS